MKIRTLLEFFLGKSDAPQALPKQTEYKFSVTEIIASGDKYEYTVQAESRKEAFDKLVIFFFGENSHEVNQAVTSKARTVHATHSDRFYYTGMPRWFAKRLSGQIREEGRDYQKDLQKYCINNNITLKPNR